MVGEQGGEDKVQCSTPSKKHVAATKLHTYQMSSKNREISISKTITSITASSQNISMEAFMALFWSH